MKSLTDEDVSNSQLEMYFEFLDDLRETGATNMIGAQPYLSEEFGLNRDVARRVLTSWCAHFDHGKALSERVNDALDEPL